MSQSGMHPEEIKAAIRMKFDTVEAFSLSIGYSKSAVRNAFKRRSPAVEAHIAHLLQKPLHQIWPDRYDTNNLPIRQTRKRISKNPQRVTAKNKKKN